MPHFKPIENSSGRQWTRATGSVDRNWVTQAKHNESIYSLDSLDPWSLLGDFSVITKPYEIRWFVAKYGLLWHETGGDPFFGTEVRESARDWMSEAGKVREALELLLLIQGAKRGDQEDLGRLKRITRWEAPRNGLSITDVEVPDAAALVIASGMIARHVRRGLLKNTEAFYALTEADPEGEPGVFVMSANPPDLLGYIYHCLAVVVSSDEPVRGCEECGRVFPVRDRRQRFCSDACRSRRRHRRGSEALEPRIDEGATGSVGKDEEDPDV